MTSDSTPAFEIEKEALKTEIETGIQAGVDHLEAKTAKRKDADKYHNTRHLLKQYRKVAYAIKISEADMNVRMEMEHGTRLSTLEVNAELAGVDLSGSKLEGYARTVIRSKNMLQIIDNALNTVRMDPDHGELMVAGRGIAAVAGAVGGTVFNHHSSSNSTHTNAQAAGAAFTGGGNGLVGVTKRAAGNAAAASATGNAKGLSNLVGGAMFESSLQNGGKFAMSVVGAVAKGSISSVGSITGDQAAEALTSYLGYSPVDSGSALADDGGLIPPSPITSEDVVTLDGGTAAGTASPTASANGTPIPSGAREHDGSVVESARISGAPPIFQNVEIGGGRITGLEVSPDRQSDREFAMYSTEQYMAPTGPYDTVQTVDGASWYRQYAQPKVEKTPYTDEGDKIRYEERIVSQMPPVPKRKDKI